MAVLRSEEQNEEGYGISFSQIELRIIVRSSTSCIQSRVCQRVHLRPFPLYA